VSESGHRRTGDRVVWMRVLGCLLVPGWRRPLNPSLREYRQARPGGSRSGRDTEWVLRLSRGRRAVPIRRTF